MALEISVETENRDYKSYKIQLIGVHLRSGTAIEERKTECHKLNELLNSKEVNINNVKHTCAHWILLGDFNDDIRP